MDHDETNPCRCTTAPFGSLASSSGLGSFRGSFTGRNDPPGHGNLMKSEERNFIHLIMHKIHIKTVSSPHYKIFKKSSTVGITDLVITFKLF